MMLIVSAVLLVVLNVLDSVTTYVGLHKLPEGLQGKEGNPVMAKLLTKWPRLTEALKQLVVAAVAGYLVYQEALFSLVIGLVAFGLVVVNNTYLIVIKLVTRRPHTSPIFHLAKSLGIPKPLIWPFVVITILGPGWAAAYFIVGVD